MIPDSKKRLKKACDDLDMLLVSVKYVFLVIYSSSLKIFWSSIEIIQLDAFFVDFKPAFEHVLDLMQKRTCVNNNILDKISRQSSTVFQCSPFIAQE